MGGTETVRWHEETNSTRWDQQLARLGGHPLQSALWGDARRQADGIEDRRFIAEGNAGTVMMARMELRRVRFVKVGIGWIPRGPCGTSGVPDAVAFQALKEQTDFRPELIVTDRWQERPAEERSAPSPETIWVDLSAGREGVWQRLDRQWRYGVGKAQRAGVTVGRSRSNDDIRCLVTLMDRIGSEKKFQSAISEGTLRRLLRGDSEAPVSAHMFVARCEGAFAAAALILRSGLSVHYLSGGTDRRYSRQRVGEALHWSIIEWAIGNGLSLYDLEGIDRGRNPGTFAFKKKMGGREVALAGKTYHAFSSLGRALAVMDRYRERFALPFREATAK